MAENKKDSFTFSDKIKNSKPAVNPFSKRASKIGNNGKPKKTIFDRSRRDTPFFIAAAAALLLLPFLYKYSGTIHDDGLVVTPGSSDSVFEPERFGYAPSNEDPFGEVVQLTGRDPLDLIRPLKSGENDEPLERDGIEEPDEFKGSTETEYEEDRPSPYREAAPQQVRAAVQRTPTKVPALDKTGLYSRGGAGLPDRFGGQELKNAAKQSSAAAPKAGAKPVSLQPLRAAGAPSRAYYGQGAAAQARASRDAMSKTNAQEALRDAMFAPVENGRLTGLGNGSFAGGGAPGSWNRDGKTESLIPWWWDEMKAREHAKWEWKYFLWRRNLVEPLIKKLAEAAANLGCCLVMGKDNCSAGRFLGVRGGEGSDDKCGDMTESDWLKCKTCLEYGPFGEATCKAMFDKKDSSVKWKGGDKASRDMNFMQVRWDCMGGALSAAKGDAVIGDRFNCEAISNTHNFDLETRGVAEGWHHIYHVVVAKNYSPFDSRRLLCSGESWNYNKKSSAGVSDFPTGGYNGGVAKPETHSTATGNRDTSLRSRGINRGLVNDECVIYVAEGKTFDWNNFKQRTLELLEELKEKEGWGALRSKSVEEAFANLQLDFIEAYAFKDPLVAKETVKKEQKVNDQTITVRSRERVLPHPPMRFADFESVYVLRKGNETTSHDVRDKPRTFATASYSLTDGMIRMSLSKSKGAKTDAARFYCDFNPFRITALPIAGPDTITGVLNFQPKVHGVGGQNVNVTVDIICPDGRKAATDLKTNRAGQPINEGKSQVYIVKDDRASCAIETCVDADKNISFTAHWKAVFSGKTSTDDAEYTEGEHVIPVPPVEPPCEEDEVQELSGTTEYTHNGVTYICPRKQVCRRGSWIPQIVLSECKEKEEIDPNKPRVLQWAEQTIKVPSAQIVLSGSRVANNPPVQFKSCKFVGNQMLRTAAQDRDVLEVMREAKRMFDAQNMGEDYLRQNPTSEKIVYTMADVPNNANEVPVAALLHAMMIYKKEGKDVPLNAVCALGKTVGLNSDDTSSYMKGSRFKQQGDMDNMFGAYAAFMGADSSFFPRYKYGPKGGKAIVDWRFFGCNGLKRQDDGVTNKYHYGHYNWNYKDLGDFGENGSEGRDAYIRVLNEGAWKGFPLKAIADAVGTDWFHRSWNEKEDGKYRQGASSIDGQNRIRYWEQYIQHKVYTPDEACSLEGTMSVDDVIKYINAICAEGTSIKPTNGEPVKCDLRLRPAPAVNQ